MVTAITIAGSILALIALGWQLYAYWAENPTRPQVTIPEPADRNHGGVDVPHRSQS
jgi:hypothetical protein